MIIAHFYCLPGLDSVSKTARCIERSRQSVRSIVSFGSDKQVKTSHIGANDPDVPTILAAGRAGGAFGLHSGLGFLRACLFYHLDIFCEYDMLDMFEDVCSISVITVVLMTISPPTECAVSSTTCDEQREFVPSQWLFHHSQAKSTLHFIRDAANLTLPSSSTHIYQTTDGDALVWPCAT